MVGGWEGKEGKYEVFGTVSSEAKVFELILILTLKLGKE